MIKGLGADFGEKHEPAGDIDTDLVDGLKALDPNWPIREADIEHEGQNGGQIMAQTASIKAPRLRRYDPA